MSTFTAPAPGANVFRLLVWRIRSSLKARMVAAFIAISLLVGVPIGVLVYREAAGSLRLSVSDRLRGLSVRRVVDVNRWVTQQRDFLQFLAGLPAVNAGSAQLAATHAAGARQDPETRNRLTRTLVAAIKGGLAAKEVELLSPIGATVLASTDPSQVGSYRVTDPYFTEGLTKPFIQNIYPSPVTGRPTLTVSTPLKDSAGKSIAVLAAHLNLDRMDELLAQASSSFPLDIYLVNRSGEIVSAQRFGTDEFRRGVTSVGIQSALDGGKGVAEYKNYAGVAVIGAFQWMPERELALMVEVRSDDALAPARELLIQIILMGVFAVGLLTVGVYAVTRRVAEPVLTIARTAERVAAGDFEARAPVTTADEVGVLARSFNEMTARLRTLYHDLEGQVQATSTALVALRESEALMHGLVDNSATLVVVVDFSGRCVLINRRFEELLGVPIGYCEGKQIADTLPGQAAADVMIAVRSVREQGQIVEQEWTLPLKDGARTFLAVCFAVRQLDGTSSAVGVIATDLTERKRAEDERRAFEANVQHAQKLESLGVMAGGIAHDFNNILGAVLGNAEMALGALDDKAEVSNALEQVMSAARRASGLTRQMLAYAGRASFRREPVDLNAQAREIAALARMSYSKKVVVDLVLSETPVWIVADSAQVSQVVLNLLTNAGDAIGDTAGKVTVTTSLSVTLPAELEENWRGDHAPEGPYVLLSVQDTGKGMDEVTRQRIFEPFFTTKETGRGLGLSAVLGIVRGIGGALAVTSTPGAGTKFRLAFRARTTPGVVQRAPAKLKTIARGKQTILVVDDEAPLRTLARRALVEAGFEVVEAADGHAALAALEERPGAIGGIVLDLTMPGMGGREVLSNIRRTDKSIPVIIASGYSLEDGDDGIRTDECVQFLQKPYEVRTLVQMMTLSARDR